jgi:hypothetical protein
METITNARRNDFTLFMKNLLWFGICLFRDSRKASASPSIALYVDAPAVSLPADSRPPCTPKLLLPPACHQVNPNAPLYALAPLPASLGYGNRGAGERMDERMWGCSFG